MIFKTVDGNRVLVRGQNHHEDIWLIQHKPKSSKWLSPPNDPHRYYPLTVLQAKRLIIKCDESDIHVWVR